MEHRRVTYKLYPSKSQAAALERICDLHRDLYNAALEERISAYRRAGLSIGFGDQCKSLTRLRAEQPAYAGLNAQSLQVTLKRLDEAFGHFFRRVKEGGTPGFPRFKSRNRFSGFGFKSHGDGFRFQPNIKPDAGWRHGHLKISGVGWMQARGTARTPGQVKRCDILRKADGWFASLVLACEPHREIDADAHEIAGIDWGVATYATIARGLDETETIENERYWDAESTALKQRQRALSKALRGRRSNRAAKQRRLLATHHRRVANRRKNCCHQTTAALVARHRVLATERLSARAMTRSARGTADAPGKQVNQKAGLNRSILDTAPGGLITMLAYKAEEAGTELVTLPTRRLKPSQRCPLSWAVQKKSLDQRTHTLPDGTRIGRDHAAALVMLRAALQKMGREPAWAS